VIGDVVNTAQRLQGVAKAGQILIAQPAFEKVKESFNCNPIGEINLKHKAKPVMVYEVLA
jgi:class 3 adenylate cyclase